ncbi:MAG: NfeD family protein [Clostridium sp.]|nr:NfeD family protein [Clostridium sp.]
METWIIWLIAAAVLVIVEVMSQMIWTLCLAVGCIVALVLSLFDVALIWQIVALAVASVVAFLWFMPVFRRWHLDSNRRENRDDRTGMDALLGRRAIVTEEIRPGKLGRARIDGDNWQVCASTDSTIHRGSEVVVTSYDSIVLHVQPVNS